MKKYTAIFLAVCLLFFTGSKILVSSQELTADKAYEDYLFVAQNYDEKHEEYVVAKNAYLKNKTLNLQNTAQQKTAQMLTLRDQVLKSYVTALRAKLNEVGGLTQEEKATLFTKIDAEVSFFESQQNRYSETDSLDELQNKALETQSRWETSTEKTVVETLFGISEGEVRDVRKRQKDLFNAIKGKVGQIEDKGDKDTDKVKAWYDDVDQSLLQSEEEELAGIDTMQRLEKVRSGREKILYDATSSLQRSFDKLVVVNEFLQQILKEVKTAD